MIELPALDWDTEAQPGVDHGARYPRVLVVEARPALRSQIGRALRRAGLEVDFAMDAAEAASRLDSRRYAVAVLDVDLPEGAGLALCRRLARGGSAGIRMPVLAVSASATLPRRLRVRLAGARACLSRPMELDHFVRTVWALAEGAPGADAPAVPRR